MICGNINPKHIKKSKKILDKEIKNQSQKTKCLI